MATTAAKKAPTKKTAAAKNTDDDLSTGSIPEELRFSTDSGERRDPEVIDVVIDGQKCKLTQPSDGLMVLIAVSFSPQADDLEKVRAMLDLCNVCLDTTGRTLIRQAMYAKDNSFDDAMLGEVVGTILNRWAPELAADADLTTTKTRARQPQNRAARRQATRK